MLEQWKHMWMMCLKFTLNCSLKEVFFYKMIYHWYLTPDKLSNMQKYWGKNHILIQKIVEKKYTNQTRDISSRYNGQRTNYNFIVTHVDMQKLKDILISTVEEWLKKLWN